MPKMNYDEADLSAVSGAAQNAGINMREDHKIHLASELNYVKTKTYDAKLPEMNGLRIVGVSNDVPLHAETYEQKAYDQVGMAKVISNYADDLPRADVARTERIVKGKDIGNSYGYNIREVTVAAATGSQLPTRKAMAARKAILVKHNMVAMVGDADYGLFGLTNHPNIGTTIGLNGNWAAPTTTAEQVLEDLYALYDAVSVQSKGVHVVNKINLPAAEYGVLARKIVASTKKSVKEMFLSENPGVVFERVPELKDQAENIIVGEFNSDNILIEIPELFNQHPAQARNLEFVVNCTGRTFGVDVPYPLAFTKAKV